VARFAFCQFLRRSFGNNLSAAIAGFWSKVNYPIRTLDDIKVGVNNDDGMAASTRRCGFLLVSVICQKAAREWQEMACSRRQMQ